MSRTNSILSLSLLAITSLGALADERPNIMVILCDDLGYGDLACYGNKTIRTPNLDRLSSEGIRLTDFYSTSPVCSASRVGLLTGRTPNRAGVYDWIPGGSQMHMDRDAITIPSILKKAGYATCLTGKWHCNGKFNSDAQPQPGDFGFDHWFATQNNASPSHQNPNNFIRNGKPAGALEGFSCQIVAREAIAWLEQHHSDKPDTPFFSYVAFHEPHEPIASPAKLVAGYPDAKKKGEALYYANVENMDAAVGEIMTALDRLDVAENTLVIFTSDNGPETLNRYSKAWRSHGTPGPLRGMKLHTHEAGIRVNGIARWPKQIDAGQTSSEPSGAVDLLPTFASLAAAEIPLGHHLDGADALPALKGGAIEREQALFWCYYSALNESVIAIRRGDWKLLARLEVDGKPLPRLLAVTAANQKSLRSAKIGRCELYKISEDIAETRDLAGEMPAKVAEMSAELWKIYQSALATGQVWD
jgi:arylsulfatase A